MFYATSTAVGAILYVFFLLSLYWTAEVIRNTGHTTVCGTFATWYFMGGQNNNMPHNPTLKSAGRALSTSFGSICFGSLIVAIIQTVRALLRSLRRKNSNNLAVQIIVCLVDCILAWYVFLFFILFLFVCFEIIFVFVVSKDLLDISIVTLMCKVLFLFIKF